MRILIAEDDVTFLCILSSLVTKWGYEPVVASDGIEARAHLEAADGPQLALLDWMMPGLDGLELCRHIRATKTNRYTYIIIVSANSQPQDAITALEAGADDIVTKPFHAHELRARINTARRILAFEERLSRRASYDDLTGLPNRSLLAERFRQGAEAAVKNGEMLAIVFIDLDRFKIINDTLGHAAGDAFLKVVSARLSERLGQAETLARVGGDEFVYLARVRTADAAAALAARLHATLQNVSYDGGLKGGRRFATTGSIGISLFPRDGEDFQVLLQSADAAMYEFKRQGRVDGSQFFNQEIGDRQRSRLMLETRLSKALQCKEFVLHYQPILRSKDMRVVGSEALLRWNDPARGIVLPQDFIPAAEETGHIGEIGKWVLNRSCRQAKQWMDETGRACRVGVNVSGRQFDDGDLVTIVSETLSRTGLDPSLLELELTETVVVRDLTKSAATIQSLRQLGVRIALDDFGTGYSSFSYLVNLPISTLKIDRSFLFGIQIDDRRFVVLKAIVDLAHKLGINVVAEGIEDRDQLLAARDSGCDEVQGYLFARPAAPNRIPYLMNTMVSTRLGFSADLTSFNERVATNRIVTGKSSRILFDVAS